VFTTMSTPAIAIFTAVMSFTSAGRLHGRENKVRIGGEQQLAAFDFSSGSRLLTEAGHKEKGIAFSGAR
jgi:hypothetical protein